MSTRNYTSVKSLPSKSRKLKELMLKSDNRTCADCTAPDPKWASTNIGVFLCFKCSDAHKNLGPDISKVLSTTTLDEWSEEDVDSMVEIGGNSSANSIYEAYIPDGFQKPNPDSSLDDRAKFIRSKYELQEFLKPSLRIVSSKGSLKSQDSLGNSDQINFISSSSKKDLAPEHMIGDLRITVVKGENLAVRDLLSSDPYVVLTLGQQRIQTTVKKSNLNPVWDEVFQLSVCQDHGALTLQVYDHDLFSADDLMGEAVVDLMPMITAATAFGNPSSLGDMQIGKWFKTQDNALVNDSTVNIVDGKVKQHVLLNLQNVESGQVELQLEWVPLDD